MNTIRSNILSIALLCLCSVYANAYQTAIIGNASNVNKTVNRGTCLMGGGTDVDPAFSWMAAPVRFTTMVMAIFWANHGPTPYPP